MLFALSYAWEETRVPGGNGPAWTKIPSTKEVQHYVDCEYKSFHGLKLSTYYSRVTRELSVGQMVSLSLLWRRHWLQDKGCSLCFQSAGSKGWLQCQSFPCGFAVYSGLFLAGISWSVRGTTVGEGCLVGEYSLHFCAWNQLSSCFWWAFLLPGN